MGGLVESVGTALVVAVELPFGLRDLTGQGELALERAPERSSEAKLAEAVNLAESLGLRVLHGEGVTLNKINPATLLGGGKVEELAELAAEYKVDVVVIDAPLSPRQQRNLEVDLKAKVLDRTGLILEIFASRARTRTGKLQVELAQLTYAQSRLVRQWTHLERQRGGTGKASGPGERQLDIDRTLNRERIKRVKDELADVSAARGLQRMARQRASVPTVALVGYTNAGKSTLFNRLVEAGTLVADALFATLDPLMRKLELPDGLEIVLADTVGFVADLPHELVEAFKATLEEVVTAEVLLEVRDASNPDWRVQAADVAAVLEEIGAAEKRRVIVYNKADKLPEGTEAPRDGVLVSAVTGQGVDNLLEAVEQLLKSEWTARDVMVSAGDGKRLAWLYAHGEVQTKSLDGEEWRLKVRLRAADWAAWEKLEG